MEYAPTFIANNVLRRAFAEDNAINPAKLQAILYFIASEYQKETHEPLFDEPFETLQYGSRLRSVLYEFREFQHDNITRFARDGGTEPPMIHESADPALHRAIERVWAAAKARSVEELSHIIQLENSAWHKSFQAENPYGTSANIAADTTYSRELGLV